MRTRTKTPATRQRSTPAAAPATVSMPPSVAILAFAAAGTANYIPDDFRIAWQRMPALVAQMLEGEGDSNHGVTRENLIEGLIERDLAAHRASKDVYRMRVVRVVDQLKREDIDRWTELLITIGDAAFYTGLAMGLYLTTHPAPVAVNTEVER